MIRALVFVLGSAAALQQTAVRPVVVAAAARRLPPARAAALAMEAEIERCALIKLSAEDPLRVAKVLKRAWMEGGVKRGLIGSVLVGTSTVQIAAQGPVARLQSFANWIETSSMLVTDVEMVELDECPTVDYTSKFPLADAEAWSGGIEGSFAGDLASKLKTLSLELSDKQGTTHSNDEGLF